MVYQLTSKCTGETFARYDCASGALGRVTELFTLFGRERVEDLLLHSVDDCGIITLMAHGEELVHAVCGSAPKVYKELYPKRNCFTLGHIEQVGGTE